MAFMQQISVWDIQSGELVILFLYQGEKNHN